MDGIGIYDLSPKREFLSFDLREILDTVADDIADSRWRCRNVECNGEDQPLEAACGEGREFSTVELAAMARATFQTIWGDFIATRPPDRAPWLVIRAIDSTCFEVFSSSAVVLDKLRARFTDVRPTDPAADPQY